MMAIKSLSYNDDEGVKGELWLQPYKMNLFFSWSFIWQSTETKIQHVEQKKQWYLHSKHIEKDVDKVLLNLCAQGLCAHAQGLRALLPCFGSVSEHRNSENHWEYYFTPTYNS